MAFYDIARGRPAYDFYYVLRGTFASGAAGVWSTRHVKTTSGLLDGRMEIEGSVATELPEVAGGEPVRPGFTVRLHNHDNSITTYIRGTASVSASTENRGDSFINYTGRLYFGVRDPADGTLYEQVVSPTVCLSGEPSYDGFTVTLPLSSYDDRILGRSIVGFTVRELKGSAAGSAGDGTWVGRYDDGTFTQTEFTGTLVNFTENLDETVPYLYGRQVVPLLKVGDTTAADKSAVGVRTYIAWASLKEPILDGFKSGSFRVNATFNIYVGTRSRHLAELSVNQEPAAGVPPSVTIETVQREITNAQGETFEAWVVVLKFVGGDDDPQKVAESKLYVEPTYPQGVATLAELTVGVSAYGSAPSILKALVRDHSETGASAIDTTSFGRAQGGWGVGILYYPNEPIRAALKRVANAGGYSLWVGVDNTLHVASIGSFTSADKTTVAAGLQHITAADVLGDWMEALPYTSQQLGAPAKRIVIRWTGDQERFWTHDGKSGALLVEAPGVLATTPDISENIEGEIDGTAIYPPLASTLLTAATVRRGLPRRRIMATCRAWFATIELGTMFYLSHPRGLGDNTGGGYSLRVVRLESASLLPNEDGCRCRFEDLGPVADLKLGVLDAISNWVRATPAVGANTLTLTSGSAVVTSSAAIFTQAMADDGCHLWTPGAATAANRSSKRITVYTSNTQVTVESNYSATENIAAAGSGYTADWIIMETQASKGSNYRSDKIRVCVEATGVYRDGSTAGFVIAAS